MALLTTLKANHEVRLGVITIRITIGFNRGNCVTWFFVRRGVAKSNLIREFEYSCLGKGRDYFSES